MKHILKAEEVLQLIFAVVLYQQFQYSWTVFALCILLPDISMLGYLVNNRVGAISYNVAHHKAVAISIGLAGYFFQHDVLLLSGLILYAHSSMDRMFGYGLKHFSGFKETHLGRIGNS
jgi:hypothetical protein